MNFATLITLLILIAVLFLAIRFIYREKKQGKACIGCPYSGSCAKQQAGAECDHFNCDDTGTRQKS